MEDTLPDEDAEELELEVLIDLTGVSRAALEALARAVLQFDYGPGFPHGRVSEALDRVRAEASGKSAVSEQI